MIDPVNSDPICSVPVILRIALLLQAVAGVVFQAVVAVHQVGQLPGVVLGSDHHMWRPDNAQPKIGR